MIPMECLWQPGSVVQGLQTFMHILASLPLDDDEEQLSSDEELDDEQLSFDEELDELELCLLEL